MILFDGKDEKNVLRRIEFLSSFVSEMKEKKKKRERKKLGKKSKPIGSLPS